MEIADKYSTRHKGDLSSVTYGRPAQSALAALRQRTATTHEREHEHVYEHDKTKQNDKAMTKTGAKFFVE